jgi:hypothetical protein
MPGEKQMVTQARSEPQAEYSRRPVYTLNLNGDVKEIEASLAEWRFVGTSASQPLATIANGIIGIGSNDQTTFNFLAIDEMADCSVECTLRIIDDGGDHSRWAGVRVRGFLYDIRFGYLVYLRATGTVELYCAETVLDGANDIIVTDAKDTWTKIRIDILGVHIRVWVNGKLHIDATDRKFADKGLVYFHTFGTHAQVSELSVYEIIL